MWTLENRIDFEVSNGSCEIEGTVKALRKKIKVEIYMTEMWTLKNMIDFEALNGSCEIEGYSGRGILKKKIKLKIHCYRNVNTRK